MTTNPLAAEFDVWRVLPTIVGVVAVVLICLLASRYCSVFAAEQGDAPYKVAEIYKEMRERVLKLTPAELGETDDSKILAVVMDTGFSEGAFTLVATVDGSASLYFSSGGGVIGAGQHAEGAKTSKAFLTEAAKYSGKMTATKDTPMAAPGKTVFYLVSGKGIVTVAAKEDDFGEGRHAVSPLFHRAHELITVIRSIDEARAK
ncbi:MAG: hypothetical protein ACAI34_25605 [Verrucomicrobium sp.]